MPESVRGKKHARVVVAQGAKLCGEIGISSVLALKSYIKGYIITVYLEDFISFQASPHRSNSRKKNFQTLLRIVKTIFKMIISRTRLSVTPIKIIRLCKGQG